MVILVGVLGIHLLPFNVVFHSLACEEVLIRKRVVILHLISKKRLAYTLSSVHTVSFDWSLSLTTWIN